MKSIKQKFASLVGLATLFVAAPSLAGGPLAVCQPGVPYLWANGGTNITFNPDQGNLGPVPSAAAIALVASAFQVWEDIPSSTLTYGPGATLPVDVDITNFGPYLEPVAPDGLSAVVFDDTGEIFTLLFGAGTGVLGFAGPEWVTPATCTIDEGVSFLNGPSFTDATAAFDVMVHEFGHWTNFAHTVVNGQLYIGAGDTTGPNPNNTFGPAPNPFTDIVETMYPFYFGPGIGTQTLAADDVAIASRMYPGPNYFSTTGEISGTILLGSSGFTGVNVIARNVADPFNDAVSAISSDFTDNTDPSDPNVGLYRITGLTPGASYGVYIDEVLAGGFSTTLASPLPGPEEFYNGAEESSDPSIDDPSAYEAVMVAAGAPNTGIDIIFNSPGEGDPLAVGDDGSVLLPLPFKFCVRDQAYDAVYVNANGHLTFGAGNSDFTQSTAEFLAGPPMIAGLWADLQPVDPIFGEAQGSVFYTQTSRSFTVTWENVPEWDFPVGFGSNTFDITLYDNSKECSDGDDDSSSDDGSSDDKSGRGRGGADVKITHYAVDIENAIVGISGGLATTSGAEVESDLSAISRDGRKKIKLDKSAAVFENFTDFDNDLNGATLKFSKLGKAFKDKFEKNNSLKKASKISTPFDTLDTRRHYSSIDPEGADVDFYRFYADAGKYLVAEVVRGQIDSVLGVFYCPPSGDDDSSDDGSSDDGSSDDGSSDDGSSDDRRMKLDKCDADTAILLGINDDSNGLLSRIEGTAPVSGTYALAVSFYADFDFDGVDPGQGPPFDGGRYVLDVQLLDGVPLSVGDEAGVILNGFGFSFPYDGVSYDEVWINGNGHLSFGGGVTSFLDFDFIPSIGDFEAVWPRAAGLWADLNPEAGGLVLANTDFATYLRIEYQGVPEWPNTGSNSFSITLHADGMIDYDYGSVSATSAIIGTAQGNGAASTAVDLSVTGGGSISTSPVEEFTPGSQYDLGDPDALTFTPD